MEDDERTELQVLRNIERMLDDNQSMVAKAALNAEAIRQNNEAFAEALHRKLGEIHETVKTIGWWACFCFLALAAIKWGQGV